MKRQARGQMLECDAPGCLARHFEEKNDPDPPNGVRGTVFEIDDFGGRGGEFWACSRLHVMPAIEAVLSAED